MFNLLRVVTEICDGCVGDAVDCMAGDVEECDCTVPGDTAGDGDGSVAGRSVDRTDPGTALVDLDLAGRSCRRLLLSRR